MKAGPFLCAALVAACVAAACGGQSKGTASKPPASRPPASTTTFSNATVAPATTKTPVPANAGTWSLVPAGPNPIDGPVAWTGHELLAAVGGCCDDIGSVNLSAYNPATGTWRKLPATPLTPRAAAAGVWTGTEMIVAGGTASADGDAEHEAPVTDGAAWNASTNTWHAIAPMPTTLERAPTAVWTGKEMLVWSASAALSGVNGREVVLAYDPATNRWRSLPPSGLTPRFDAVTVWAGTQLVVWGGDAGSTVFADGARLDPATGIWTRLPAAPVPARGMATAVWSGREVLLWGGDAAGATAVGKGAAYNPVTNSWRALPASPLRARAEAAGVWTGRLFIVIGGSVGTTLPVPGPGAAAYDPSTNRWTALPAAPRYPQLSGSRPPYTADQRAGGLAVWTGHSVVVVGGLDFFEQAPRVDGLAWTPAA